MRLDEEVVQLKEENKGLRELLKQALARIAALEAELEQARKLPPSSVPSFVKASTSQKQGKDKQSRRKRAKDQNGSRQRETPERDTYPNSRTQATALS